MKKSIENHIDNFHSKLKYIYSKPYTIILKDMQKKSTNDFHTISTFRLDLTDPNYQAMANLYRTIGYYVVLNFSIELDEQKDKRFEEHTVASLHWLHLTTCCSLLPEMSIIAWQTLQVTMCTLPWLAWYDGGSSSGPIGDTVLIGTWTSSPAKQDILLSSHRDQQQVY